MNWRWRKESIREQTVWSWVVPEMGELGVFIYLLRWSGKAEAGCLKAIGYDERLLEKSLQCLFVFLSATVVTAEFIV